MYQSRFIKKWGVSVVLVVRKKTVVTFAVAILTLSILCVGIYEKTASPASALPVSNRVIILDAGHGGQDGGAVGSDGTVEKDLNLKVALKVQKLLEQSGCTVFMTRSDDRSISSIEDDIKKQRKVADLNNRKQMTKDLQVEAFVSIHMNTYTDPQYSGTQVFYSESPELSKSLAEMIQEEVRIVDSENTRAAKNGSKGIFILNDTSIPSVVVECGFLSNEKDLARLKTDDYQQKLATAIYNGIMKFYATQS